MLSAFGPLSIVLLIFGGCCSNVFALEAIIRSQPDSGMVITFFQFVCCSLAAYPSQFSDSGRYNFRKPLIPVRKWVFISMMHFGINVLNNWAFAYSISVPVHIILRSFGSVTTMLAGFIRGKRYSKLQVLSVVLLTVGVFISAWADSESKGKSMSIESDTVNSEFITGIGILLSAQFLSAFMGAYIEDAYAAHGASWTESLFYCHTLCLPLFLPMSGKLQYQYRRLAATPHLNMQQLLKSGQISRAKWMDSDIVSAVLEAFPQGILFLLVNVLTQLACISGVNLLSSKTSAVTVTIVLNIRKLASFIFSTIIFGHQLSSAMILGSALVFGSGALYGWETSWRLPQKRKYAESNGTLKKET